MTSVYSFDKISVQSHHLKQNICGSRARYRDGRKDRAVKVYTVNQESIYLLIFNVPSVGGGEELRALCDQYGIVEDFKPLDDYTCEEFTEVYLVKYKFTPAAKAAKIRLDDRSFLGSNLHVCYAPEFESVLETKLKLQQRRKYIAWKTNSTKQPESTASSSSTSQPHPKPNQISDAKDYEPVTYIWAGKQYTVFPNAPSAPEEPVAKKPNTDVLFVPRQFQKPSSSVLLVKTHVATASESAVDASYQDTISQVRDKVSKVSVPNMRISWKRKKKI